MGPVIPARVKGWNTEDVPLVEEDQVGEYLSKLDIDKSMGLDGIHPQVLREQSDVIVRPFCIIFAELWQLG